MLVEDAKARLASYLKSCRPINKTEAKVYPLVPDFFYTAYVITEFDSERGQYNFKIFVMPKKRGCTDGTQEIKDSIAEAINKSLSGDIIEVNMFQDLRDYDFEWFLGSIARRSKQYRETEI